MPEIIDHVAYLSQEIGPRPAGTEEEQQAALYITEQLQKDAGLSAVIEDFSGTQSGDAARVVCYVLALLITVLAFIFPVLGVASIVVTIITALLFAGEAFDKPILSKAFARGVSQNVVAKYEPTYSAEAGGTRRRKIVLVSRYDSGKVRAELSGPFVGVLPIVQWATLGGMIALPVLAIIRNVFFLNAEGTPAMVLMVLTVIALIPLVVSLVIALLHKIASYNEGANCNASGTAVLLDVARRVAHARSNEQAAQAATIHGEEAARAEGLVPEGAQLVYEAAQVKPPELAPQSPEARLAAAKAAVAALSGKPVGNSYSTDLAQNLVQVNESPLSEPTDEDLRELRDETREALNSIPPDTMQAALEHAEEAAEASYVDEASSDEASFEEGVPVQPMPSFESPNAPQQMADDGVPEWFKKAQEKAKKPKNDDKPVQRSRYASALDAAVSESAGHFAVANEIVEQRLEQSLDASRDEIREVKPPLWAGASADADAASQATAQDAPSAEEVDTATMQTGALPVAQQQNEADPSATTAMPPIDVRSLHLNAAEPSEVSMPAFLDPRKVQEQKRAALAEEQRTNKRVTVAGSGAPAAGRTMPTLPQVQGIPQVQELPQIQEAEGIRPAIELPDIPAATPNLTPITELPKQRAPLAEVAEKSGKSAAKSLLTMLPSIDVAAPAQEQAGAEDAAEKTAEGEQKKAALRSMLPSLSGAIRRSEVDAGAPSSVSTAGSFVPAGATGTFAPVGDELLQNVDPNDIYVDDADDSAYEEHITETGAFAGPGYVDMPKSRAHRLFDRFRRKKKNDMDPSPQEWLEVDETFDARTVGAQRGGWESFRPEDEAFEEDAFASNAQNAAGYEDNATDGFDFDDDYDDRSSRGRRWQGGAFSLRRAGKKSYDDDLFDDELDDQSGFVSDGQAPFGAEQSPAFAADQQAFAGDPQTQAAFGAEAQSPFGTEAMSSASMEMPDVQEELRSVHQFHDTAINTEVWFVALGSELAKNAGMHAFLDEHQQDLRGSIIIDLDALGAGDLCLIESEGMYRPVKTSSRMSRYVKKAAQATGASVGTAQLKWEESAATVAMRRGFQALHLVGMDGKKPALYAQSNDMLENIDEALLISNADFVMEMLKNI